MGSGFIIASESPTTARADLPGSLCQGLRTLDMVRFWLVITLTKSFSRYKVDHRRQILGLGCSVEASVGGLQYIEVSLHLCMDSMKRRSKNGTPPSPKAFTLVLKHFCLCLKAFPMKQTVPSRTEGVLAAPRYNLSNTRQQTSFIGFSSLHPNVVLLISTGYLEQNLQ